jgi:hypothetical protein
VLLLYPIGLMFLIIVAAGRLFQSVPPADDDPIVDGEIIQALPVSLFEKPDSGSRIIRELPRDTVVTYSGTDGQFLRVRTAENVTGYVAISACTPDDRTEGNN